MWHKSRKDWLSFCVLIAVLLLAEMPGYVLQTGHRTSLLCFFGFLFSCVLFDFLLAQVVTSIFVGKLLILFLGTKKKDPTEKRQT